MRAMDLQRVQLTRRFILWQRRRGHRTATDDIVCAFAAHAAMPEAGAILDLGAGQGAVALMLSGVNLRATLTAVEAQEVSYELLVRNVAENGLAGRVTPIHADLRTVDLGDRRFDLVSGSPPYVRAGAGVLPRDAQRAAARFELRGGIEAYCEAASRWLSREGRAVFLVDGAQDERSRRAAAEARLFLEERMTVYPRPRATPRFIVYRVSRSGAGSPCAERALTVRDENGRWTAEFNAVRLALDLPQRPRSLAGSE
jgi:tRNA1Val (adenine37-N6)-methyltransferase